MAFRTRPPRAATLGVALIPWLVGAAEMFAGVQIPHTPAAGRSSSAARC